MDPLEILVVPKSNNIEDYIRLQHIPVLLLIVGFCAVFSKASARERSPTEQ